MPNAECSPCRKHRPTLAHVLITGASSGLGAELARVYARQGITLSLTGRDEKRLHATAKRCEGRGSRVVIKKLDVTDAEGLKGWILERDNDQPLDLVIANAGISAGTGGGRENEEQSRAILDVNLTGVLNTIHPILPRMLMRQSGQIAIMSSLAAFRGFAGAPAYCASKAAVRIYGEALRGDVRHRNVRINVICPGFVKTPMTDVNRFKMPFIMSAAKAARIIKAGLAKDRARIAFPWPVYLAVRFLAALPPCIMDFLASHLPRKTSLSREERPS